MVCCCVQILVECLMMRTKCLDGQFRGQTQHLQHFSCVQQHACSLCSVKATLNNEENLWMTHLKSSLYLLDTEHSRPGKHQSCSSQGVMAPSSPYHHGKSVQRPHCTMTRCNSVVAIRITVTDGRTSSRCLMDLGRRMSPHESEPYSPRRNTYHNA